MRKHRNIQKAELSVIKIADISAIWKDKKFIADGLKRKGDNHDR